MKWTVGIITAPRKDRCHLVDTLQSFQRTGFSNINVFAEPGSFIPEDFQGSIINRRKRYGDWTNWATALYELLLSEPDTDYFFMAEDDGVLCQGVKAYLERTLPQLGEFATVSPYCPGRYHRKNFTGYHNECHGSLTWSTLTVIMARDKVIQFFSDPDVQRHRFENVFADEPDIIWGVEVSIQNSVKDAVLGKWAKKNNLPMYYHTPSLADHIGTNSTLAKRPTSWENLAMDFVGADFVPPWTDVRIKKSRQAMF